MQISITKLFVMIMQIQTRLPFGQRQTTHECVFSYARM